MSKIIDIPLKLNTIVKLPIYKAPGSDRTNLYGIGSRVGFEYFHITSKHSGKGKIPTFYGTLLTKKGIFEYEKGFGDKHVRSFYVNKNDIVSDDEEPLPWVFVEDPETVYEDELIYEEY